VPVADTPLWLAHNWPGQYGRCVVVGRRHICRRCLALYPVALVVVALGLAGVRWPERHDGWLIWLLVVPATVELCLENVGLIRHSPTRLVSVTLPLAVGCGVLFLRYLDRLTDPLVWTVVAVCGGACVASIVVRARRSGPTDLR
jgi:uncharacterized membrane protein